MARVPNRSGGLGRASSAEGEAVSDALRRGSGEFLSRRRVTAALSLASIGSLGLVSAYQTGLLRTLPEPPLPLLDSDRVDASGEAYSFLAVPDAPLAVVSYGVTLTLAAMGGEDRWREQPWLPLALAGKVASDAAGAVYLTLEQGTRHRAFCFWCLLAAGASVAMVPQVIPEARRAWPQLWRRARRLRGRTA